MAASDAFLGKNSAVDFDSQAEISSMGRKKLLLKKLLEAMGTQNYSPTVDAGLYKPANWGDALGQLGQAGFAQYHMGKLDDEEKDLASRAQATKVSELGKFRDSVNREDKNATKVDDEGNPMPSAMGVKNPQMEALLEVMMSNSPAAAAMGGQGMKHLVEGFITDHDKASAASGGNVLPGSTGGDPTTWRPMPKTNVQNGTASVVGMDAQGNMLPPQTAATEHYGAMQPAGPNMPAGQYNAATNEYSGKGGPLASAPPGVQFNKSLQELDVKTMGEGRGEAGKAWAGLQTIADAQTQLSKIPPAQMGGLAGFRVGVNQVSQTLGLGIDINATRLEVLGATLGDRMLERLRLFAPVSDSDKVEMKKIAGSYGNTAEGLNAMLDFGAKILSRTINQHNKFVGGLEGQEGYGNLDRYKSESSVSGSAPDIQGARGSAAQSVEDILKKYPPKN